MKLDGSCKNYKFGGKYVEKSSNWRKIHWKSSWDISTGKERRKCLKSTWEIVLFGEILLELYVGKTLKFIVGKFCEEKENFAGKSMWKNQRNSSKSAEGKKCWKLCGNYAGKRVGKIVVGNYCLRKLTGKNNAEHHRGIICRRKILEMHRWKLCEKWRKLQLWKNRESL